MVKTQVLRDGKVNSEMLKNDLQIDPDDKQKLLAFMRLAERGLYNWEEFRGQFLITKNDDGSFSARFGRDEQGRPVVRHFQEVAPFGNKAYREYVEGKIDGVNIGEFAVVASVNSGILGGGVNLPLWEKDESGLGLSLGIPHENFESLKKDR